MPQDTFVKVDCDAFSIIIIFDSNPSNVAKMAIKELLYLFGSQISEVSLPKKAVANKTGPKGRKDQIFGSEFVKSNETGNVLYESEVIVTSTPVKIAVHKSCREKIRIELERRGFPIDVTHQAGLCFNPNSTSKLPTYGHVVNALLSGSACVDIQTGEQSFQKNVIHIGNVGTLHPVDNVSREEFSSECMMRKIFSVMDHTRHIPGIQIEVSQLDIAFNVPSKDDKLVQWSCEHNPSIRESVFSKSAEMEGWAIHDITRCDNQDIPNPKDQRGTIRVRQKHWDKPQVMTVFGNNDLNNINSDSDDFLEMSEDITQFLEQLYLVRNRDELSTNEVAVTHGNINCKNIYSMKAYSDVAHYVTRNKSTFPLSYETTNLLPSQQVIQLQRQVYSLGELMTAAFQYISRTNVCGRIEFSIRPDGKHQLSRQLRLSGHFVDFLAHVYVGLCDMLCSGKYTLRMHTELSYETVAIRCNEIIQSIQQIISFRAQKRFNEVYTSTHMHLWIKAMFCIVTTLLGLTHDSKLRPVIEWLKPNALSSALYDPLNIKTRLLLGTSILQDFAENGTKGGSTQVVDSGQLDNMIHCTFTNCLQHIGTADMDKLMSITKDGFVPRQMYLSLSAQGKFILAQNISESLIPSLAKLIHHNNNENNTNNTNSNISSVEGMSGNNTVSVEDDFIDHIEPITTPNPNPDITTWSPHLMHMYVDPENACVRSSQSLMLLHQFQIPNVLKKNIYNVVSSDDPIAQIISRLCEVYQEMDIHNPLFLKRLKHYILKRLKKYNEETFNESAVQIRNTENTAKSLRNLANVLQTPINNRMTKDEVLLAICQSFHFPCDGTTYNIHDGENDDEMNTMLYETYTEVSCLELRSNRPHTHRRFYRSYDNLHIQIPNAALLMQEADITNLRRGDHYSDPFLMLSTEMYPNRVHGDEAKNFISLIGTFFSSTAPICDCFILPLGENNPSFGNCVTIEDLNENCPDVFGLDPFHPRIIFPTAALLSEKNIVIYDCEEEQTSLHYFDFTTKKVVTYDFNNLSCVPTVQCLCFAMKKTSRGHFVFRRLYTQHHSQPTSLQSMNINSPIFRSMLNPQHLQYCQRLKDHPYSLSNQKSKNIIITVKRLLVSTNVKHSHFTELVAEDNDTLDMQPFLQELISSQQTLDSMFNPDIVADFKSLFPENSNELCLQEVYHYVISESSMEEPEYFSCIIPFICLKYKLWFCIWESCAPNRLSHFYWYDPYEQKVLKSVLHGHIFHKEQVQFFYLQIVTKSSSQGHRVITHTKFFDMPTSNPFNNSIPMFTAFNYNAILSCRYSYLDMPKAKRLFTEMRSKLKWDIEINTSYTSPNPNTKKIIPIPTYNGQNELSHIAILVIFPKDNVLKRYLVCLFHRNMSRQNRKEIVARVMEDVLSNNIDRNYAKWACDYNNLCDGSVSCSTSFLAIILSYLAGLSPNQVVLEELVKHLLHVPQLYEKTQSWTRDCLLDAKYLLPKHIPHWLARICHSVLHEAQYNSYG